MKNSFACKHKLIKGISMVCTVALLLGSVSISAFAIGTRPARDTVGYSEEYLYDEDNVVLDPVYHRAYGYDPTKDIEYLNSARPSMLSANVLSVASFSPFPASIDNSTSIYFPAVGDQGMAEACSSFASAYYQYTFAINKRDNVATTPDNTCCPQFIYSYLANGRNVSNSLVENYNTIKRFGCLRYGDYDPTDINTTAKFYKYWNGNEAARIEAIKDTIDFDHITVGYNGVFVTFDSGTADDNNLFGMKQLIKDGNLLTFGCNFSFNTMEASEEGTHSGEDIIVRGVDGTNNDHSLTIVGYDDNVCVDVNDDGVIEPAERGAFKVVNSWGTRWANDGFIWLLYDACNEVSQNSSTDWEDEYGATRKAFVDNNAFYYIRSVTNRNAKILCVVNMTTQDRYKTDVFYSIYNGNVYYAENIGYFPDYHEHPRCDFDGSLVLCIDDGLDNNPNFPDSEFYISIGTDNAATATPTTINYVRLVDDMGHQIARDTNSSTVVDVFYQNGNEFCRDTIFRMGLQRGDLNYDTNINGLDSSMLMGYENGVRAFSTLQTILADLNNDGYVNSIDQSLMLQLLIDG